MTAPARTCPSCQTPIPPGSAFCASCGAATPTEISQETGTIPELDSTPLIEAEQRERVQAALGDGFELGRLLGRGGFAEVYATTDRKLQRTVAVKVLRPDLVVNRSLTERFLREARAAAKLRHPHIIPIYQVGEAEGLAYFLMPLIEGESLREYMERVGPLPVDEARRILREVADALAVAHEAGLVHRDIKPDNIMLEGRDRRSIVTDFGIAKALGSAESGLTGTGMIVGTLHYMSPEQASGEREIDGRSDTYSLGVVAYQMLTGALPFDAVSGQALLAQHLTLVPKPIQKLRPDVPNDVAEAIRRCLAKPPAHRWQSASQLATAMATPSALQVRKKSVPSRAIVAGAAVVILAGALLAVWPLLRVRETVEDGAAMIMAGSAADARHWQRWESTVRENTITYTFGMSPATYRDGRWAPSGPLEAQWLANVGDQYLAVDPGQSDLLVRYDGAGWRNTRLAKTLETVVSPFNYAHATWTLDRGGMTHPLGDQGSDLQLPRLDACVTAMWTSATAAVAGNCEGGIYHWSGTEWRRAPTGTAAPIAVIAGPAASRLYATAHFLRTQRQFNITASDSLLEYDGAAWKIVDPRPAEDARNSVTYHMGGEGTLAAFADSGVVLGGRVAHPDSGSMALLALRERPGTRFRRIGLPGSVSRVDGIWGRSRSDFYAWNRGRSSIDPPAAFHVTDGRPRLLAELAGERVLAMANLRDEPYMLTSDGLLRRLQQGHWAPVGRLPTSMVQDVSVNEVFGPIAVTGNAILTVVAFEATSWRASQRPRGALIRVASRDSSIWALTDSSEVMEFECRTATKQDGRRRAWRCDWRILDHDRDWTLRDLGVSGDGRLLAVGAPGIIAVWRGTRFELLRVPPLAARDTFERIAALHAEGMAVLGRTALLQSADGRTWQVVQERSRGARDLTLLPGGVQVLARPTEIDLFRGDSLVAQGPAPGMTGVVVHALPDRRIVAAYSNPDDPTSRGWLEVLLPPSYRHAERFDLPVATDIRGLADDGRFLYAVGSGWFAMRVALSDLPTESGRAP